jgi:GT2 family glycosyltransferase
MPSNVPWHIIHVHAEADPETIALPTLEPSGRILIFFWKSNRPVGHRIVDPQDASHTTSTILEWARSHLGEYLDTPSGGNASSAASHRVSVIIPTRDRPADLERCLRSFQKQTRPPDEIIVVDNASAGDGVRDLVASMPWVKYVREPRPGLDFARNAGILAAEGDLVAFCDDDVVLHDEWCERLVSAFDAPEIMAVTGLVLPLELESEAQRLFEFHWGFGRGYRRIDFDPEFFEKHRNAGCPAWTVGAGASMAFRRTAFAKVGLFDERLDAGAAGCSGDSEIWYRLLAEGWTCRYEPAAVSFHRHRTGMEALQRQIRAYMRGHTTALLVQYKRYGHKGNLKRAFLTLPKYYASRMRRLATGKGGPADILLRDEVMGYLSGFLYFMRHPRTELAFPPHAADRSTSGGATSGGSTSVAENAA